MYKSVFMFFGKGDEQLALDADSVVCRKEEGGPPSPPPSSLYGTPLCRRSKQKHKQKGGRESSASRQKHFLRCTSCGWSQRSASLVSLLRLLSSNLPWPPSSLPSFLSGPVMSLLPPCCGVTDRQRLLLAASPVDTVVMSLTPGSTIGHPRPPQWAASLVYSVGEWGGEPRRDGLTPSLPSLPLSTPQQRSMTAD